MLSQFLSSERCESPNIHAAKNFRIFTKSTSVFVRSGGISRTAHRLRALLGTAPGGNRTLRGVADEPSAEDHPLTGTLAA
jgi:hypothetical protein